jgi:CDP-glucose 4,6-dehydratase
LEKLVILRSAFRGKRVWLSGHTGFKGGWLAVWLTEMGARVTGFSLPPQTPFFSQLKLKHRLRHEIGDLRDAGKVRKSILRCRPDFVFHLAAQPLVRDSYLRPLETYEVNTLGTAHVLETLRDLRHPCAAIFVTTDKVYRNEEKRHAFREQDPLGGQDPYSASKAAAEILISSYRDSFFQGHPVRIASARSGNVIGGGDWARDRIVPDAIRSWQKGKALLVRNPSSVRPWQHVLDSLRGYLILAEKLWKNPRLSGAYNFGPNSSDRKTVRELIQQTRGFSEKGRVVWGSSKRGPAEARVLALNNSKAKKQLGFHPVWGFRQAVVRTFDWYADQSKGCDAKRLCLEDIQAYEKQAAR